MKCIGFDCTEDHRTASGGTYSVQKGMNICADPALPRFGDRYLIRYPLREWGMDRAKCGQTIADAGLPIPPKSACFFCPAMRLIEIERLKELDPAQYALAIAMEDIYRTGRHFRGDDAFTLTAVHKETKERAEFDLRANSTAWAREQFRKAFDDTVKPYKYTVRVKPAVKGLGRNTVWAAI